MKFFVLAKYETIIKKLYQDGSLYIDKKEGVTNRIISHLY